MCCSGSSTLLGLSWSNLARLEDGRERWKHSSSLSQAQLLRQKLFSYERLQVHRNGDAQLFRLENQHSDRLHLQLSIVALRPPGHGQVTTANTILLDIAFKQFPSDRLMSGAILHIGKAWAYLEEYVQYFLKVSVSEQSFIGKLPSLVGVSIIAASRRAFGIVETWPHMLENLSGYCWAELSPSVHRLLCILSQWSNTNTCDEGYVSCNGSPSANHNHSQVWQSLPRNLCNYVGFVACYFADFKFRVRKFIMFKVKMRMN